MALPIINAGQRPVGWFAVIKPIAMVTVAARRREHQGTSYIAAASIGRLRRSLVGAVKSCKPRPHAGRDTALCLATPVSACTVRQKEECDSQGVIRRTMRAELKALS
jgi:hypothetical protein